MILRWEELGDEQNRDGLHASEVHATVIPITSTPKKKFSSPLVNVYLH